MSWLKFFGVRTKATKENVIMLHNRKLRKLKTQIETRPFRIAFFYVINSNNLKRFFLSIPSFSFIAATHLSPLRITRFTRRQTRETDRISRNFSDNSPSNKILYYHDCNSVVIILSRSILSRSPIRNFNNVSIWNLTDVDIKTWFPNEWDKKAAQKW